MRRPLGIRRGRRYRSLVPNRKLVYYLNIISCIQKLSEGEKFSTEDYMKTNMPEDCDITDESICSFIEKNIRKGILDFVKKEEKGKVYFIKTSSAKPQINSVIGNIVSKEENVLFTLEEIIEEVLSDESFIAKSHAKQYIENNINSFGLRYLGTENGEKVYAKPKKERKDRENLITLLLKCDSIEYNVPFRIDDICESPDTETKRLFDLFIYNNNEYNPDIMIRQKGLDENGEMVYIKTKIFSENM